MTSSFVKSQERQPFWLNVSSERPFSLNLACFSPCFVKPVQVNG